MADSPERLPRVPEIEVVPETPDIPQEVKNYVQKVETEPQAVVPTVSQQGIVSQPTTLIPTQEIPYPENILAERAKSGKIESSGTWFAANWVRWLKMAVLRGIRVLVKSPVRQPGS